MKLIVIIIFHLFYTIFAIGQANVDSLKKSLGNATTDSARFEIYRNIYSFYEETNRDSALFYTDLRLKIAQKNNRKIEEAYILGQKAYQLSYLGLFSEALTSLWKAMDIANDPRYDGIPTWTLTNYTSPGKERLMTLSLVNHMFGHLMRQTNNIEQHIIATKKGRQIALEIGNKFRITVADMVLGSTYITLGMPDSAYYFAKEGEQSATDGHIDRYLSYVLFVLGDVYKLQGNMQMASTYYHKALNLSLKEKNLTNTAGSYTRLFEYFKTRKNTDSMLYYAKKNLEIVKQMGNITAATGMAINIGTAYENVYKSFWAKNKKDSANKYLALAFVAKDSIFRLQNQQLSNFQQLAFSEQNRIQKNEKEKILEKGKSITNGLLLGFVIVLTIAGFFYRNNRIRKKTNKELQKQKTQIEEALNELKATQ